MKENLMKAFAVLVITAREVDSGSYDSSPVVMPWMGGAGLAPPIFPTRGRLLGDNWVLFLLAFPPILW